jgi:hypothetical protein
MVLTLLNIAITLIQAGVLFYLVYVIILSFTTVVEETKKGKI